MMNCWEFMKCGREEGGKNVDHLGTCPAYPDDGKRCANVVGTFCDLVQALRAVEYSSCSECPFYNSIHFDESAKREDQEKGAQKALP
jgi:hypothetical protein